ncbi:TetR/AcrR family transcriptional regulator [Streptomyces triticirhizae]|uniref:TetR/AcrR family transcriptional regulator n=1 Tax=Streptomyces triticirhizae TaxID=2483353 RepID=A0A3M2LTZ8_9ACTN|nr:TetR/AcrR family transcriptional regulator [Streptomyces triticirhizae]RMI38378.1 TetR/AcrR family transcriptional regulator [Streptomyces triticirhizae]
MSSQRPYHHGDLRRALVAEALEVIASEGPNAVSLRALARRAGVSHAAPAHHFGDRAGLLTVIAVDGYRRLADELDRATDLRDLGGRYVAFALAHPAHFQVMFRPELLDGDDAELAAARAATRERLARGVAAREAHEPEVGTLAAWSLAHGLATLLLTGNLPTLEGLDPREVFHAVSHHPLLRLAPGEGTDAPG